MKFFLLLLLIFTSVLEAQTFSVMTFNVENLFDNQDDVGKDDKAYLPASLKTNIDHQKSCMKIRSTTCLLYTSPSPRDTEVSRMPSSA